MPPIGLMSRVGPLLLALATARAPLAHCQGSWKNGRASFYGTDQWSIHKGSCGYGYQFAEVGTGWDVTAISDASSEFLGSCGRCYEVRCRPTTFTDGYGNDINRQSACRNPTQSVVVKTVDNCPCNFPSNNYSNKRWCCGDAGSGAAHMDLSIWAFEKLGGTKNGVMGIQFRSVQCDYKPPKAAPALDSPTPGQGPPEGAKPFSKDSCTVKRFDSDGARQGAVAPCGNKTSTAPVKPSVKPPTSSPPPSNTIPAEGAPPRSQAPPPTDDLPQQALQRLQSALQPLVLSAAGGK